MEKDRERNTIAIMAAILLMPKLKELLLHEKGIRRGSPRWTTALQEVVSVAEEIYGLVTRR